MHKQMWLAFLGAASFAGTLIALGFFLIWHQERQYKRAKKDGRI